MRGRQGFPWIGVIVAGAVVCGVQAPPGVAFATPAPNPPPAPPPVQASAQTSVGGGSGQPVAEGGPDHEDHDAEQG